MTRAVSNSGKFVVNNKVYLANYSRKLKIEVNIRRKDRVKKVTEFVKKMKKVQEEVGIVLKKAQKEMRRQADRG